MQGIRHERIQNLYGYCLDWNGSGQPAIVSQYYAGGGLHEVLRKARSNPEYAKKITWARRLRMVSAGA
jgi:hypothetical protein